MKKEEKKSFFRSTFSPSTDTMRLMRRPPQAALADVRNTIAALLDA